MTTTDAVARGRPQQMIYVTRPRWPPCPYKPLKVFFSGTKRPMPMKLGMQKWLLKSYQLYSNDGRGSTVTYFTVWENTQETIEAYEVKVGTNSKINECMIIYDKPRSRSFIVLCPRSLRFIFKLHFFPKIIQTKNKKKTMPFDQQQQLFKTRRVVMMPIIRLTIITLISIISSSIILNNNNNSSSTKILLKLVQPS